MKHAIRIKEDPANIPQTERNARQTDCDGFKGHVKGNTNGQVFSLSPADIRQQAPLITGYRQNNIPHLASFSGEDTKPGIIPDPGGCDGETFLNSSIHTGESVKSIRENQITVKVEQESPEKTHIKLTASSELNRANNNQPKLERASTIKPIFQSHIDIEIPGVKDHSYCKKSRTSTNNSDMDTGNEVPKRILGHSIVHSSARNNPGSTQNNSNVEKDPHSFEVHPDRALSVPQTQGIVDNERQKHNEKEIYVVQTHKDRKPTGQSLVVVGNLKNGRYVYKMCGKSYARQKEKTKENLTVQDKLTVQEDNMTNQKKASKSSLMDDSTVVKDREEKHVVDSKANNNDGVLLHVKKSQNVEENVFECVICKETFASNFDLQQHWEKCRREKGEITRVVLYKCSKCDYYNAESYHVKKHLKVHIPKAFTCEECGKSFKTSSKLKAHMTVLSRVKLFKCDICEKLFSLPGSLKSHSRVHCTKRPVICTLCGKGFVNKKALHAHLKSHKEKPKEKPYKCDVCGLGFYEIYKLKTHAKRHNISERPYQCEQCGKCFSEGNSLKTHMKSHSDEKPFQCDVCGKSIRSWCQFACT